MRSIVLLALILPLVYCKYNVQVYLRRLDVGQGFLINGTHCSPYWNVGEQCSVLLKIGVCLGKPKDPANPCPTELAQAIDLKQVTTNANSIDFQGSGTAYGSWKNPADFPDTNVGEIYEGFSLYVEMTSAPTGDPIDRYSVQLDDGSAPNNFRYYSHPRDMVEPTLLSVAWRATGDLPTPPPPPTTAAPTTQPFTGTTTTPGPTPSETPEVTTEPTTTPQPTTPVVVTEIDCDAHTNKTAGVKPILINGKVINVYCEYGTSKAAYTVIQSRGELGNTLFNVSFDGYKSPIGKAGKGNNFWLGLDNMYYMTNQNGQSYSMMIEVCCGGTSVTKQYYYSTQIGAGPTYTLNVASASPSNTGLNVDDNNNAYGRDIGQPFRTYDSWNSTHDDRDFCSVINTDVTPTVTKGTGGWWFGNCGSNLNGVYYAKDKLGADCKIPLTGGNYTAAGTGVELLTTTTLTTPLFTGVSYTRARMALFRGTEFPLGITSDFCN